MEIDGNKYLTSDWRSLEMHRLIAKKLETNPSLVDRARSNISRWKSTRGVVRSYTEWEEILSSGKDRILRVLVGEDQDSARLRSSTPFTGILSETERKEIFARWSGR
ncbi:hypothetical protein AB6Q56_07630 [Dechloromonas sp. ARDL1]|uniref:hypothetical protein n=1 Tax=Dechloromonas sp. ARDL1 TaxID=3322121 RepID=UPI003DA7190E